MKIIEKPYSHFTILKEIEPLVLQVERSSLNTLGLLMVSPKMHGTETRFQICTNLVSYVEVRGDGTAVLVASSPTKVLGQVDAEEASHLADILALTALITRKLRW